MTKKTASSTILNRTSVSRSRDHKNPCGRVQTGQAVRPAGISCPHLGQRRSPSGGIVSILLPLQVQSLWLPRQLWFPWAGSRGKHRNYQDFPPRLDQANDLLIPRLHPTNGKCWHSAGADPLHEVIVLSYHILDASFCVRAGLRSSFIVVHKIFGLALPEFLGPQI